jgi:beta-glucosidase
MGYRWFEKNGIEPQFPSGHGLNYTAFEYGTPSVGEKKGKVVVSLTVKNTGEVAGALTV